MNCRPLLAVLALWVTSGLIAATVGVAADGDPPLTRPADAPATFPTTADAPTTLPTTAESRGHRPTTRPVPAVQRVLVISVDGLRPDMLLRTDTPNMHALFQTGAYTFWAKTVAQAITLPSHTSMLTGVSPRKHEIEWNRDLPLIEPVYPRFPTLFAVAHRAGYTTAMVAGKSKFNTLAPPGTLDWSRVSDHKTSQDKEVAHNAISLIREHQPEVMFIHFPGADNVGHAIGWATKEQAATIENIDELFGEVLHTLEEMNLRDSTLVILTSDHGGAGKSHGPDDPRSRHIPWIINGPGIAKNLDLTVYADLEVHTEDTFATACYFLAIPLSKQLDGRPVLAALAQPRELIHDESPLTAVPTQPADAATGVLATSRESPLPEPGAGTRTGTVQKEIVSDPGEPKK